MLSYAKHGKFPALTQAAQAESRRKKRPFRPNDIALPLFRARSGSWDGTDCKCAASVGEWPRPAPCRCGLAPAQEAAQKRFAQPITPAFRASAAPARSSPMNFASDNTAPVAPAILD